MTRVSERKFRTKPLPPLVWPDPQQLWPPGPSPPGRGAPGHPLGAVPGVGGFLILSPGFSFPSLSFPSPFQARACCCVCTAPSLELPSPVLSAPLPRGVRRGLGFGRWGAGRGSPGTCRSLVMRGGFSIWGVLFRGVKIPSGCLWNTSPPPQSRWSWSSMPALCGARHTPVPQGQMAGTKVGPTSWPRSYSLLPLQIEFVTGTKKGTTTNATATTTTTASTAVAGRRRLSVSSCTTDRVRFPCLVGGTDPMGVGDPHGDPGLSSTSPCFCLSPEMSSQLWRPGGLPGSRAPPSLSVAGLRFLCPTLSPLLLEKGVVLFALSWS